MISTENIIANPWNPNYIGEDKFNTLIRNIKSGGMLQPILVRQSKVKGIYEIVDGEHRFRASKKAGLKEIMCVIVESTDEEAKLKTLSFNNLRGVNDPDKIKALIIDLEKTLNIDKIIQETGMSEAEMNRIVSGMDFTGKSPEEIKRTLIEQMGISPEQAEAMAGVYAYGENILEKSNIVGKQEGLRDFITFYFDNDNDAKLVKSFFISGEHKEPDTERLLKIVNKLSDCIEHFKEAHNQQADITITRDEDIIPLNGVSS